MLRSGDDSHVVSLAVIGDADLREAACRVLTCRESSPPVLPSRRTHTVKCLHPGIGNENKELFGLVLSAVLPQQK